VFNDQRAGISRSLKENKMKILECVRRDGIAYVMVDSPVGNADVGRTVYIEGADKSVNGTHKVASVAPGTIRIAQPGLIDIPAGRTGGTLTFEGPAPSKIPAKTVWATSKK
jgi:septum formation inhibitor-activating ATPase MinD